MKGITYEKITVGSIETPLNAPSNAVKALLVLEAANNAVNKAKVIRFLDTGDTPTTTEGQPLGDGAIVELGGVQITDFKAVSIDGLDHTLNVTYYG